MKMTGEHVVIRFEDSLECSDPWWARSQYAPVKIHELIDIENIIITDGQLLVALDRRKTHLPAKFCSSCKTQVLWNHVVALQDRITNIEDRLAQIED